MVWLLRMPALDKVIGLFEPGTDGFVGQRPAPDDLPDAFRRQGGQFGKTDYAGGTQHVSIDLADADDIL